MGVKKWNGPKNFNLPDLRAFPLTSQSICQHHNITQSPHTTPPTTYNTVGSTAYRQLDKLPDNTQLYQLAELHVILMSVITVATFFRRKQCYLKPFSNYHISIKTKLAVSYIKHNIANMSNTVLSPVCPSSSSN